MKVIGITGGVGSGKTELLRYIKEHYNCRVILSDEAAHEVERPGGSIYEPLVALLSEYSANPVLADDARTEKIESHELLNADGTINRCEMAARIFANRELLTKVNVLVHPAVRVYIEQAIEEEQTKGALDYFFIEAALLIEAGYQSVVDSMWYIYCRPEIRRERLRNSRGYTDEKIDSIMKSQLSEEAFRAGCDVVIDNSGSLAEACAQIDAKLQKKLPFL